MSCGKYVTLLCIIVLLSYYYKHFELCFILNQVLSNTSDGRRYIDFYNVVEYPYLAIIDPRTGECMKTYSNITVDSLMSDLNDMLSTHASPECTSQDSSNSNNWNNYPISSKQTTLTDQVRDIYTYPVLLVSIILLCYFFY